MPERARGRRTRKIIAFATEKEFMESRRIDFARFRDEIYKLNRFQGFENDGNL